jgi:hypothetical protein
MKTSSLSVIFAFIPVFAFATAQAPEILFFEGEEVSMFTTPLESYFSEEKPRPDDVLISNSSANWRGYIGHWEISENRLILTGLHEFTFAFLDESADEQTDTLIHPERVFGSGASYPMEATWFTGMIRIPRGEMVRYVHMGFGSQYESEILIQIESGLVSKQVEIKYDPENYAYSSTPDLQWMALGDGDVDSGADGSWIDARLLVTPHVSSLMQSGEVFTSRAIAFLEGDSPNFWAPNTPRTQSEHLPVHKIEKTQILSGSHVEFSGRFYSLEEGIGLEVISVRLLNPGETMHHSEFPGIWEKLESEKQDTQ